VEQFGITLDQVSWLGNIGGQSKTITAFLHSHERTSWFLGCLYLPAAIIIPICCGRYGIRRCVRSSHFLFLCVAGVRRSDDCLADFCRQCDAGAVCLILASWVRFSGTASNLGTNQAYALLMLGQVRIVL
jgi:FLVCR family MFS transporter 7